MVAQMIKNLSAMQETQVRSLSQEDSPRGGDSNPLQYSCLENSMGSLFPSLRDLPDPGIKPGSPAYRQIPCHLSHQGSPVQVYRTLNQS